LSKEWIDLGNFSKSEGSALTITIPVSVIADRSLATLESVVEYLKEVQNLSYHQIAELLQRDDRTVWTVYSRAKKKRNKLSVSSEEKVRGEHGK